MFSNLMDFGLRRDWKQAIGFYLFYSLIFVVLGMIYGILFYKAQGAVDFHEALRISAEKAKNDIVFPIIKLLIILVLSVMVFKDKKLYKNALYLLLGLLSVFLMVISGALFGLMPLAFLTTRENGV